VVGFFEWLAETRGSVALHESQYVYLGVLSIHVLTLCVFVGTAAVIDLRLLGVTLPNVRVSEVVERLIPWTVTGFAVMVVSGTLLFYASPVSRYQNLFFRAKMFALAAAGVNAWLFHRRVYRRVAEWDLEPVPPFEARVMGGIALALWAALITLGRMIPYQVYWFDCSSQPQPAIINWLSGCIAR
jgi:uncharacterized protein DUF6644